MSVQSYDPLFPDFLQLCSFAPSHVVVKTALYIASKQDVLWQSFLQVVYLYIKNYFRESVLYYKLNVWQADRAQNPKWKTTTILFGPELELAAVLTMFHYATIRSCGLSDFLSVSLYGNIYCGCKIKEFEKIEFKFFFFTLIYSQVQVERRTDRRSEDWWKGHEAEIKN